MKCNMDCLHCKYSDCVADEKGNIKITSLPRTTTVMGVPPISELRVPARFGFPANYVPKEG